MFVRNSAQRNSLSERMKGLGRDVKKKIAARLKSRGSRDEEVCFLNFISPQRVQIKDSQRYQQIFQEACKERGVLIALSTNV